VAEGAGHGCEVWRLAAVLVSQADRAGDAGVTWDYREDMVLMFEAGGAAGEQLVNASQEKNCRAGPKTDRGRASGGPG